jgi:hypothetical protein
VMHSGDSTESIEVNVGLGHGFPDGSRPRSSLSWSPSP